jgi:hypothetical protein
MKRLPYICETPTVNEAMNVPYEVVSKILRIGAAIYTAVVVARSTGPNRPNCEFRVLLRENVRSRRPELWR